MTLAAYAPTWLRSIERSVRPATYSFYKTLVEVHLSELGHYRVARVTPPVVRSLIEHMQAEGYASRTVRGVLDVLRHVLRQAMADGIVDRNAVELVRRPRLEQKAPRHFTSEQAQRFLAAAEGDNLRPLFALALYTGLRRGELLALTWNDVDLKAGWLNVRQAKTGAGVRRLPLVDESIEVLRQLERRPGPVFLVSPSHATRRVAVVCQRAGLEPVTFHSLRHSTASILLDEGVDRETIREILGHTRVRMTSHYARSEEARLREALGKASRAIGRKVVA